MDMEESAEESQAAESAYEEELIPKIITDEIFDEVTIRAQMVCSSHQIRLVSRNNLKFPSR